MTTLSMLVPSVAGRLPGAPAPRLLSPIFAIMVLPSKHGTVQKELCEKMTNENVEILAGEGRLNELKEVLGTTPTQLDLDTALENAIAYSQLETAAFLLSEGADISYGDYQGVYYAVHNNEIDGVRFAIENGVDPNVNGGGLFATAVVTAHNTKDTTVLLFLLESGAEFAKISQDNRKTIDTFKTVEITNILKTHNKRMSSNGNPSSTSNDSP